MANAIEFLGVSAQHMNAKKTNDKKYISLSCLLSYLKNINNA